MPASLRNRRAFPLARPRSTVFRAILQHDEPNDLLPAPLARYRGGERRPHALSTAMRVTAGPWRPPAPWLSALVAGVASACSLRSCCHAVVATACIGSGDLTSVLVYCNIIVARLICGCKSRKDLTFEHLAFKLSLNHDSHIPDDTRPPSAVCNCERGAGCETASVTDKLIHTHRKPSRRIEPWIFIAVRITATRCPQ